MRYTQWVFLVQNVAPVFLLFPLFGFPLESICYIYWWEEHCSSNWSDGVAFSCHQATLVNPTTAEMQLTTEEILSVAVGCSFCQMLSAFQPFLFVLAVIQPACQRPKQERWTCWGFCETRKALSYAGASVRQERHPAMRLLHLQKQGSNKWGDGH